MNASERKLLLKHVSMTVDELHNYMCRELSASGYALTVRDDKYIFAVPNTDAPKVPVLFVAHMDKSGGDKPVFPVLKYNATVLTASDTNIGGDDRCGTYIINRILACQEKPYILLTHGEEKGGIGVKQFIEDKIMDPYVEDIHYMIEFDRRGIFDYVYYDDPDNDTVNAIWEAYGYVEANGSYSDVSSLTTAYKTAHVNLSCGYQYEHTKREYIFLPALDIAVTNAIDFVVQGAYLFPERITVPEKKSYVYKYGGTTGALSQYNYLSRDVPTDDDDDYDDTIPTKCPWCNGFIKDGEYVQFKPNIADVWLEGGCCYECFLIGVHQEWWRMGDGTRIKSKEVAKSEAQTVFTSGAL